MKIVYYLFLLPISKLPFSILYGIANFLYFIVYKVFGYRRKVVQSNLRNSFPEKSEKEIIAIEKEFYKYLSRLVIESVKNFSITKTQLEKRMVVTNPEVMDKLYDLGKSVVLVGAHYHNWEYLIVAQNFLLKHQAVGLGKPLTNPFMHEKMTAIREQFGMKVVHAGNFKDKLKEWEKDRLAILVLFDQSPGMKQFAYWKKFLNQQTAFLFGTEKIAVTYDFPVVEFQMVMTKKGFYEITLKLVSENPKDEEYGVITEKLIDSLETQIVKSPAYWLWSHKRWKRKAPENVQNIKPEKK